MRRVRTLFGSRAVIAGVSFVAVGLILAQLANWHRGGPEFYRVNNKLILHGTPGWSPHALRHGRRRCLVVDLDRARVGHRGPGSLLGCSAGGHMLVPTRVRPFPELVGQAFISCTETTYFYNKEHDLPAAVLLDAARPGAVPPGLLGMKPLAGHPSVFTAPPDMFARRIRGAWLVVQEEDTTPGQ